MISAVEPDTSFRSRIEDASKELPEEEGIIRRPDGLKYLSPERATAFLGLVRAGSAIANRLSGELEAEHGISLRAFEVLLFLAVFAPEGGLRMTELTEQAPLSQSRVSRLVDDLERRGLVGRSPARTDGRGVTVSITPKGTERFKAAQETHLAGLDELLFSHLDPAEIRQLAAITSKIVDACKTGPK
jgi:DNA-binding MarR family transcriptional regulator